MFNLGDLIESVVFGAIGFFGTKFIMSKISPGYEIEDEAGRAYNRAYSKAIKNGETKHSAQVEARAKVNEGHFIKA